jgi:hypothetical protein
MIQTEPNSCFKDEMWDKDKTPIRQRLEHMMSLHSSGHAVALRSRVAVARSRRF